MKLAEFYEKMGTDLGSVLSRIPSEKLVRKFVGKYPADPSYAQLNTAIEEGDWQMAFRAAHTLKGVAANLGMEELRQAASDLTENLRGGKPLSDPALLERVRTCHKKVVELIGGLED